MNTKSAAYQAGFKDGLAWDLDGFDSIEEVKNQRDGWDDATLSALGCVECVQIWGTKSGDDFSLACAEYNAGAYAGACAPQEQRTGLPPRAGE